MNSTAQLTRIGDTITLDDYHQDLLATLTGVEVASSLTLAQARELLSKAHDTAKSGMSSYGTFAAGFLTTLDQLLA